MIKRTAAVLMFVAFALVAAGFVAADDDPIIQKIVSQLEKWTNDRPQEKVYLQFDKPYYGIGDNIWFKAYITVGPKHQLSAMSGALNVELINERDSIKQWIKLPVTSGVTWGDFALADSLKEGNYRIRAYTNWMRNAGDDYFFEKAITIGNGATTSVFTKATYNFTKAATGQQVNANINYADLDGTPLANKEVSYNVRMSDKQILKGKGITDAKGDLQVNFVNATQAPLNTGRINTQIKLDEKHSATKTVSLKAASGQADVQFFPESGNLVNGVRSRVAFKAVGPDGLGIAIKGSISDNDNTDVAILATRHLGMGSFAFTPQSGKTYKAKITYPDGSQSTVNLPAAVSEGYVLTVNNSDTANIGLRVTGSTGSAPQQLYIVGQSGGDVRYVARNKPGTNTFSALIPKNKFPSGIAQFTLFNSAGQALNERIAFIQRADDMLKLTVNADQATSGPRQKVKINIRATDHAGKPVVGAFSAAVIDVSKVPVDDAADISIQSQLLLSSDLKGYIEQPNYYFTNPNEETAADLDILMLTQGYRRFEWRSLMADQFSPVTFQPEKTLQVSGVLKTSGGKPIPNGKVTLFTTAGGATILDTVADAQGRFAFKDLIFRDSTKFVLQARTAKGGKNVDIVLDNPPTQTIKSRNIPASEAANSAALLTYLRYNKKQYDEEAKYGMGNHTIMLKAVTVTEKRVKPGLENSSNLNGAGNADQVITSEFFDKMGCPTIDMCLQGRLLGVIFRGGVPYSTRSQNTPMQIIVDGVYVDDDYLSTIPPMNVASVEILRTIGNTAIYGMRGAGGVMIVNTKRGGEYNANAAQIYSPGILTYTPKGFYSVREFYSPVYGDPKTNTAVADLRTTIYWKPSIVTDQDGRASFEYYNAGTSGTYRVLIEGINEDGYLGRQAYRYKVE